MNRIVEESSQNVNSNAGIILAKQILDGLPSLARFDSCQPSRKSLSSQVYSNSCVAKAEVALMTLGKTSFSDIAAHQEDDLFADAVGGAVPSEATFRQRLEYLATLPDARSWTDDANVELLSKVEDFGLVKTAGGERLPLDIDVSVLVNDDCRKENIGFTYHRVDGFAPIFATVGRLGYQLANELRPGNQHSQKGFPEFLRRCVGLVRRFHRGRILLRIDSAHDSDDTLATGFELDDEIRREVEGGGLDFIAKRNARREDERMWIDQANGEHGEPAYSYDDEKDGHVDAFRGVVSHLRSKSTCDRPLFCVWEVKRMKRDDELFPRYSTATWWTNLPDDADAVIRLYHEHATCEQFHSELKTDMDVERLPSGDYKTNSLILSLSTLAFNVLRRIGQTAHQVKTEGEKVAEGEKDAEGVEGGKKRRRPERIRLRTVILNLMYVAAINGRHGGRKHLRLGRNCHQAKTFLAVLQRLAA